MPSSISSTIIGTSTTSGTLTGVGNLAASLSGHAGVAANPFAQISAKITGHATINATFPPDPGPPPTPQPYKYATLSTTLDILAARLYDTAFQQWTQTELSDYIDEALQTWNALTGFWRQEMVFSPILNSWWYDLRTLGTSVIPYTVTKYDLIRRIENHLLEPPTPNTWTGSAQFTLQDLLTALQRRQDDTLGTAGCTVSRGLVNAPIGGRIVLDDTVIDIRRVAWIPVEGFGYSNKILRQSDLWAARAFNPYYTTTQEQPPSNWMQNAEPAPSFDVDTVPPVPGRYDVLTINSGPVWEPGQDGTLTIPDDWTWVTKWGALMDLLSRESNAKDAMRADYCRRRYEEGLALMVNAPVTLAVRMNNIPLAIDAIRGGDDFNAMWQAKAAGAPTSAYTTANLVALAPKPDSSSAYSMTVSVVRNAPLPSQAGGYIQVARDDYDAIIDYAQHLAMFKAGGAEFAATVPLYQRFQRKAAQYNGKLKEQGFFDMPQMEIGILEEKRNARYTPGTGPDA